MSKTDQAYETLKRDILAGALRPDEALTVSRFLGQLYAQVRRHQRLIVLGRSALSDPRTDAALLATLHSRSGIERHTPLMDAALDRDEDQAVRLLQDHIGTFQDMGSSGPAG